MKCCLQDEYNTPNNVIVGAFDWNKGGILWVSTADSNLTERIDFHYSFTIGNVISTSVPTF
jgi:hypothetical protein